MATITVRNLSSDTQRALKRRAADHGRSMEAEVRAILEDAVGTPDAVDGWLEATSSLRGVELVVPERSHPRPVELS